MHTTTDTDQMLNKPNYQYSTMNPGPPFQDDLIRALDLNVVINLDNELEMETVDELLSQQGPNQDRVIGLRINPTIDVPIVDPKTTAVFFVTHLWLLFINMS